MYQRTESFSNPGECKGTLTVDGVDAPHSSIFELSAHVGTVLQDPDGQFIGLTVGEDIAFALENSCTPQDEMHAITRHAAELVGIEKHLDYAPHELSGGQKQRVSLAGVMVDQVKSSCSMSLWQILIRQQENRRLS